MKITKPQIRTMLLALDDAIDDRESAIDSWRCVADGREIKYAEEGQRKIAKHKAALWRYRQLQTDLRQYLKETK